MKEPLCVLLTKARRAANLTQASAAAKIGCSPSCLANLESDPRRKPSYETLARMVEAYKLDPRLLFEDDWRSATKNDNDLAKVIRSLGVDPSQRWDLIQKFFEVGVPVDTLQETAACLGVIWIPPA